MIDGDLAEVYLSWSNGSMGEKKMETIKIKNKSTSVYRLNEIT